MRFAQSLVSLTQRGERGRVADEQSAVQQRVDGFFVELCAEVRVLDPVLRRQGSERRDVVCRQFHGFVADAAREPATAAPRAIRRRR